ncbi:hypothetical protein BC834DRAFT_327599 [Gloeopeniophorella convolvens]|nr:hypothetical protein BC834DRAFT_327599 [Gloeopeniophorella convolvens]
MHINKLPTELLVEIFDSYRLTFNVADNSPDKLPEDRWLPLVHVCRRWRQVVLGSVTRLRLALAVSIPERAGSILPHFPASLPLILGLYDGAAISDALPLLVRAYSVTVAGRAEFVHQILPHVAHSACLLQGLNIEAHGDGSSPVALPAKLSSGESVPHLHTLVLGYDLDVRSLNMFTPSTITSFYLMEIPELFPGDVWNILRRVPRLECLDITAIEMPENGEIDDAGPVLMPCLKTLAFTGFMQWLTTFVNGITATTLVDLTVTIMDSDLEDLEENQDIPDISRLMRRPVEDPTVIHSAGIDLCAPNLFCGTTIGDHCERKARVSFPMADSPDDNLVAMRMAAEFLQDMMASVQTFALMGRLPEPIVDEDFDLQQWREGQGILWCNLLDLFSQVDKLTMSYTSAPVILDILCRNDEEEQREAEPAPLVPLLHKVTIVDRDDASDEELGPLIASFVDRRWSLTHRKCEVAFEDIDDDEDMEDYIRKKPWSRSGTQGLWKPYARYNVNSIETSKSEFDSYTA